ncbi:MAG: D-alanyl-D-alanine carboxypeptidase [Parcubacteria group bacterium Greene0714_21]|nr:MAG: D-alanyl-D-alanine carboxypeptidase [Parcubacteria group bacterium Greene0416_39]TSC97780.1 MAG: D-alanyl-D-alanine carboxypeptidase [Parcubacteria group bacterium Greene1014_47]TSD04254.1 MAG: D-alanyl-D-alanine carboxypeptidase [Parcubacteria group bacterium Greene0714_21]
MTKNIRVFFTAFFFVAIASLLVNNGASKLADFFFWNELATDSTLLTAQAAQQKLQEQAFQSLPLLKKNVPALELSSRAALSLIIDAKGNARALYEKNSEVSLPIASLTKLMTALVARENYSLQDTILISKNAVEKEESFGNLQVGEKLSVENLLYVMLIESSNDAAVALSELMGENAFLGRMNSKAKNLNLEHTFFVDVAGVDPAESNGLLNRSSAMDLAIIASYLLEQYPEVFHILSLKEAGSLINTNELLSYTQWPTPILGGKTGWTPRANGALLLVLESPKKTGYLVNVILGSDARFEEMKQLVNWVFRSYSWTF